MKKLKVKYTIITLASLLLLALPSLSENLQNGIDLYNTAEYDKAIELFNNIVKAEPKNPEPHLWLSKCYEATFDLEKSFSENKKYKFLKEQYDQEQLKKVAGNPTPEVKQSEVPQESKTDTSQPITINNEVIKEYKKTDVNVSASPESGSLQNEKPGDKSASTHGKTNSTVLKSNNLTEILSGDSSQPFVYFNCMALSPDNKYIAAGQGYDGEVKILNFDGKIVKDFKAHDKEVLKIVYSQNGKYLISGGFDKKVKIWEADTYKIVKTINTEKELKTMAVSPDGNYIATDGFSKIQLWNLKTGTDISPIKERVPVKYMRFNPKISYLASANGYGNGSLSNEISIWDTFSGKRLHLLKHPLQAMYLAYSPDGRFLAANSWQNIVIWTSEGVMVKTIESKLKDTIMALDYSPDGKLLASGTQDGTNHGSITLWDTKTFKSVKTFPIDRYGVEEIHFSPDGKYVAERGFGGNVIWLWKL